MSSSYRFSTGSSAKETGRTEYRRCLPCSDRACTAVTAGRSFDQLWRSPDIGLRPDVCGSHGIYRQIYGNPGPDRSDCNQILAAAIFNWGCAPFLDGTFDFAVLLDKSLLSGLLYLSVFSTTVAYLLQNSGQKYLSASTSAILLSMESVFGTLFSVIF